MPMPLNGSTDGDADFIIADSVTGGEGRECLFESRRPPRDLINSAADSELERLRPCKASTLRICGPRSVSEATQAQSKSSRAMRQSLRCSLR